MSEVLTPGGTLISYDDIGDSADVAILLHGVGCDRSFLAPQAIHLAERGFRVISPDLKGHGVSSAPEGDYSIRTLGAEITQLIYQLGLAKVFIIGHSMGGNVGLSVAASTTVSRGLVLIDSAVFASVELLESLAPVAPAHILASCLQAHFEQDDFAAEIATLSTPLAYIGAPSPLSDMQAFATRSPTRLSRADSCFRALFASHRSALDQRHD